eukprot:5345620-Pyramimonas_sp.AAC.1
MALNPTLVALNPPLMLTTAWPPWWQVLQLMPVVHATTIQRDVAGDHQSRKVGLDTDIKPLIINN